MVVGNFMNLVGVHPDEVYNIEFLGTNDGETYETNASDINAYSLETHKYIYEYNKTKPFI